MSASLMKAAGTHCVVTDSRWFGVSASRQTDYSEVACADGLGYLLKVGLAGMLAVFAEFERDILRDRVNAGIAQACKEGRPHGRPPTVRHHAAEISALFDKGSSKRQIAARMSISRASVRRMLPVQRGASRVELARREA